MTLTEGDEGARERNSFRRGDNSLDHVRFTAFGDVVFNHRFSLLNQIILVDIVLYTQYCIHTIGLRFFAREPGFTYGWDRHRIRLSFIKQEGNLDAFQTENRVYCLA